MKSIKNIKIGGGGLKNNLFLAPMLGFTNFAFRELIQKNAKIAVFTEMIPINALSKDSNYCKDLIIRGSSERNVFYQFFGNDEKKLVKSIQNILDLNIKIDFIDLNCGCPAQDIVLQGAGCALLKRESKIKSMIQASKKAFDIPFTIKIRTGYDKPKHLDYKALEDSGCDALFVHGRTKKQQYSGNIDLKFIKEAKERTDLPIIANGNIKDLKDIQKVYFQTDCDGYMIGRQALTNPFVFREIINGNYSTFYERIDFLDKYYKKMLDNNINCAFQNAKLLSLFLVREIKDASKIRERISKTKEFEELLQIVESIK